MRATRRAVGRNNTWTDAVRWPSAQNARCTWRASHSKVSSAYSAARSGNRHTCTCFGRDQRHPYHTLCAMVLRPGQSASLPRCAWREHAAVQCTPPAKTLNCGLAPTCQELRNTFHFCEQDIHEDPDTATPPDIVADGQEKAVGNADAVYSFIGMRMSSVGRGFAAAVTPSLLVQAI